MNSVGEIRLAGAAGMAFSVVFLVYLILVDVPDMTSSVDQAVAFYQDSGERSRSIVGGYMAQIRNAHRVNARNKGNQILP